MIYRFLTWLSGSIPPVVFDGLVYTAIAALNAFAAGIGSDEAAKFISPMPLFWMRLLSYVFAQTMLAVKMFRSTGYADYQKDVKEKSGNTTIVTK